MINGLRISSVGVVGPSWPARRRVLYRDVSVRLPAYSNFRPRRLVTRFEEQVNTRIKLWSETSDNNVC